MAAILCRPLHAAMMPDLEDRDDPPHRLAGVGDEDAAMMPDLEDRDDDVAGEDRVAVVRAAMMPDLEDRDDLGPNPDNYPAQTPR